MARIPIVIAPDPILNLKSQPVKLEEMNAKMHQFIKDMTDAIYSENAVGFAAVQFGVLKRIIVIDLQNDDDVIREEGFYPMTLINPVITYFSEEMAIATEGCVSCPDIRLDVPRPKEIELTFNDINFKTHELKATGWLARVIQHEMDHLEGKTLLDYMSNLKRDISIRKLTKFKRRAL